MIPVLMFACNRVTVAKALDSLLSYRTDPAKFPIIVSQVRKEATFWLLKPFMTLRVQGGPTEFYPGNRNILNDLSNSILNILLGGSSFARFCQQEFGEFPRLVGRYCSYLLPKHAGGTPQILVDKTSPMTGRLRVYCAPTCAAPLASQDFCT